MNFVYTGLLIERKSEEEEQKLPNDLKEIVEKSNYKPLNPRNSEHLIGFFLNGFDRAPFNIIDILGEPLPQETLEKLDPSCDKSNKEILSFFLVRSFLSEIAKSFKNYKKKTVIANFKIVLFLLDTSANLLITNLALIYLKWASKNVPEVYTLNEIIEFAKKGVFLQSGSSIDIQFIPFAKAVCRSISTFSDEAKLQIVQNLVQSTDNFAIEVDRGDFMNIFEFLHFTDPKVLADIKEIIKKLSINQFHVTRHSTAESIFHYVYNDNEMNDDKFNELLVYISGLEDVKQNQPFIIQNGFFLYFLVDVFQKQGKIIPYITFLNLLCRYSRKNIFAIHNARVELSLLRLIETMSEEKSPDIFGTVVAFISTVTTIVSSADFVNEIISALKPRKYNHQVHSLFLSTFTELVQSSLVYPRCYLFLGKHSNAVKLTATPSSVFTGNFSVGEWINIPSGLPPDYVINFMKINQNDKELLTISIKECVLHITVVSYQRRTEVITQTKIPTDTWVFLAIDFERHITDYFITFYIHGIQKDAQFQAPIISFGQGPIDVYFAGQHEECNIEPMMGSFAVSKPMGEEFYREVAIKGPREVINSFSAYIEFTFTQTDHIGITCELDSEITASIIGQKQIHKRSFVDVLIEYLGLESLIPLFSYMRKQKITEQERPNYPLTLIQPILTALLQSKIARNSFIAMHGFAIIAKLMMKQPPVFINYDLYRKVFAFFQQLDDKRMRKDVIDDFLLNSTLWIHASGEEQKLITRHWSRHLFSSDLIDEVLTVRSFEDILFQIRTHYWYTEIEKDVIEFGSKSDNPRPKDLPIFEIRSNIIPILYEIAVHSLDAEKFRSLIGHIITLADNKQTCDLLVLIKLLAVSDTTPYSKVEQELDLFNAFHHLLNNEDNDLVFNIVDVFATLHLTKFMVVPKPNIHVNLLMDLIPEVCFNIDMFSLLIPFVERYTDFLPLLFYHLTRFDHDDTINLVMKHLKPNKEFSKKKEWVFWPIVAALYKGGEFERFIMDFIANSLENNWAFTFSTIDVIGRALNVSTEGAKSMFINQLCKTLLDSKLPGHVAQHAFFDIAFFFVFFRPVQPIPISKSIEKLCAENPSFVEFNPEHEEEHTISHSQMLKPVLYEKIKKITEGDLPEYSYGLRMDENGHWLDAELAINLCKQATRTKLQTFHNVSCILSAFALQDREEEALEQISGLLSAKIADESFIRVIQNRDKRYTGELKATDCFEKLIEITDKYNNELIAMTKTVADKLIRFQERTNDAMDVIFSKSDGDLHSITGKQMNNYHSKLVTRQDMIRRQSEQLVFNSEYIGAPFYDPIHIKYENQAERYMKPRKLEPVVRTTSFESFKDEFSQYMEQSPTPKKSLNTEYMDIKHEIEDRKQRKASTYDEEQDYDLYVSPLACSNFVPIKLIKCPKDKKEYITKNTDSEYLSSEKKYKSSLKTHYSQYLPKAIPELNSDSTSQNVVIPANLLTLEKIIPIYFSVKPNYFEIIYSDHVVKQFDSTNVIKVMFRSIHSMQNGLEVFATNRKTYLVELKDYNSYKCLRAIKEMPGFENIEVTTVEPSEYIKQIGLQERWLNNKISNYEYLMRLNDIAGRSFNCLTIYPIMPNLSNNRDLTKPMPRNLSKREVLRLLASREPFKNLMIELNGGYIDDKIITDVDNVKTEFTPEFYASPSFLSEDVKIPDDNSTLLDYIIANRMKLESPEVTANLCHWIDSVFGILQSGSMIRNEMVTKDILNNVNQRVDIECQIEFNGIQPLKLFKTNHPAKEFSTKPRFDTIRVTETNLPSLNRLAILMDDCYSNVLAACTVVSKDGSIYSIILQPGECEVVKPLIRKGDIQLRFHSSDKVTPNNFSKSVTDLVYGSPRGNISLISLTSETEIGSYLSPVKFIASDAYHIVTVHRNNTTNIWTTKKLIDSYHSSNLIYSIHSSRAIVECCAVLTMFDIAALGLSDDTIDIISLATGKIERTIITPYTPKKILITDNFGLLVVFSSDVERNLHNISVFRQTGALISSVEVPYNVKHWFFTKSTTGFDRVYLVSDESKFYKFYSCILDLTDDFFYITPDEVDGLFTSDSSVVTAVTKNGIFITIPE